MRENHLEEVMVPSGTRRQPKPKDLARSMFLLRNSHSLLQNKVEQGEFDNHYIDLGVLKLM